MYKSAFAACTAALLTPGIVLAESNATDESNDVDEVVVVGRSVSSQLAAIDVSRQPVVDTATVLKEIPGANINGNGPITGIAQYRGMFGDRVAVVIDDLGIVTGGPNAMDAPLSYVSPMIAEELLVTRGIAAVSSAPESIGGHVAARLSRGQFETSATGLSGFVGSRYSGNGNISASAGRLTLAGDRHRVSMLAAVDDGEDIETPVGVMRPSRLHRERSDVSYAFNGDRGSAMLFAGRLDTNDTGTPALPMDIRFIETDLAGGQAAYEMTDAVVLEGRFAWNDVVHLMDNFGLREAPAPMMHRQNLAEGGGSHARLSLRIAGGDAEWLLGVEQVTASHDATITNPNNAMFRVANFADVRRDLGSVFVEWRGGGARVDVEAGVRAKRVEMDAGDVAASGMMGPMGDNVALLAEAFNNRDRSQRFDTVDAVLKLATRAGEDGEWRVELGSKTRAPSYQELYLWLPLQATGGLADGRSYIGNLSLRAERSNEIVLGYARQTGAMNISPQLFYRRVYDYIQGAPTDNAVANTVSMMMSGAPALEFSNVGAQIWGADLAWQYTFNERWSIDGIASYVRGRRTDVSDNLYRLAPPNASLGVTWASSALAVTTQVVAYAGQDHVAAFNDEQPTPGYGLVNAFLVWNPTESLRVEARVDNLFDTANQHHLAGINRARGSEIPVGERLYGAGRTLTAGLVYEF
jgi:iron complex outermembrane receptor protein